MLVYTDTVSVVVRWYVLMLVDPETVFSICTSIILLFGKEIVVLPLAETSKFHCLLSYLQTIVPVHARGPVTVTESVPRCHETPPINANQKSVPIVVSVCPDTKADNKTHSKKIYRLLIFIH